MSLKSIACWICLWISVSEASVDYGVSKEKMTWQAAKNKGNFATPKFNVSNSSLPVDISSNQNGQVWVGYYMKETAFEYIGCGRVQNTFLKFTLPEFRNSPGLCYSMCDKTSHNYIGLNKEKCFCMSGKPDGKIYQPSCNISSPNGNWMAGGDGYMSIYERMNTDINVTKMMPDADKCLVFAFYDGRKAITWDRCSEQYRVFCKLEHIGYPATFAPGGNTGDSGTPVNIGDNKMNVETVFYNFHRWSNYVQICFENSSFPINYNDIASISLAKASSQTWSNVIRSEVIFIYNETSNSISRDDVERHGYITRSGNTMVLNFTEDNKRRYYLQTNPGTKPTSDTSWMSTTSYTNVYKSTHKDILTTSTNGNTGPSSSPPSTSSSSSTTSAYSQTTIKTEINYTVPNNTTGFQLKNGMAASESSNVGVAVSVSVVIIALAAAVVVIIVLKRRGKIPSICIKSSSLDALKKTSKRKSNKRPIEDNVYVSSQETDYAQIDELKAKDNVDAKQDLELSNNHYAQTYFILEPGARESNTDNDVSDSRQDYTDDVNDDYNTLHETVNAGTKDNDTYDTTEKTASKLKAMQEAGNKDEAHKKINESDEDTYNHINRSPLTNGKTDNIYGIPNGLENDYGDVRKDFENGLQDGDDTYNHVKSNK